MKTLALGFLFLITAQAFAADDIAIAIDDMVKNNIISATEGRRAKLRLQSGNKGFLGSTNRMPASVHSQLIDSTHSKDLSKVQMRHIEKEVEVIFRKVVEK